MNVWLLLVIAFLVPPLGIVLLWARSRASVTVKLLGSLALLVLSFVHLHWLFGLRVEVDGTGARPIFSFAARDRHYEALERSRARQELEASGSSSRGDVIGASPSGLAWPRFRGPSMDGHYPGSIVTRWPDAGLPLLWKQPVGGGYASFVIAGGRAFTIEQRRDEEVVAAYDLATGRELWAHGWPAEFRETLGGPGPRATPTWDDALVFALGATGELKVLEESEGRVIWERNILDDASASNLTWGMAASPLIVDEKVILLPGGSNGNSVVAYDKRSGAAIWSSLDDTQAYTSPMLVTLSGMPQILVVGARRVMGITVENGSLLWDYPWVTNQGINVAQPVVFDGNRVFLSAGYGHGATVLEVTQAGSGFSARPVWSNVRMKNKFTSSVLHDGYLYGLDEAILACVEAATGELQWKGGRYGYGQLLVASGHLVVLTERGELVLVEATPERHAEVARFQAIEGKTWNHPAIADGILLVRNANEMAAFRIAP
ncbi:MAG TPA: PQQ-binding-like beta-propeller repeat protein [Vicinamibacteria bacterium]|nr:PQQ-binding-like beta-propeller repeat protein [Vicinamibacteria bacterium]